MLVDFSILSNDNEIDFIDAVYFLKTGGKLYKVSLQIKHLRKENAQNKKNKK
jgi:hypothetical protein